MERSRLPEALMVDMFLSVLQQHCSKCRLTNVWYDCRAQVVMLDGLKDVPIVSNGDAAHAQPARKGKAAVARMC